MWTRSFVVFITVALGCSSASDSTKTVDLSNRGLTKEEFFIKLQKSLNLNETEHLILRGNNFDSFLDCSTTLNNLQTLDLSQNHLHRFFFLCTQDKNLKVLNVSHNHLTSIDDNALTDRILRLRVLDLSNNNLTIVNETMLHHLTELEYLSLSHNPIGQNLGLHLNAFSKLTMLKQLYLSNIGVDLFLPEYFQGLSKLTTLDLSWNPITKIPLLPVQLEELDISGTQVTKLQHMYQPNLRELKLNFMPKLMSLTLNDLENLINLEKLSIIGCERLTHLKLRPSSTVLLPRLQRLSIKESGLKTLGIELSPLIQRVPTVDLSNNPWRCDCNIEWLNLLNTTKIINISCDSPKVHHGKLLRQILSYELPCEYDTTLYYTILWISLATLITALVTVAVLVLLRRPASQWRFKGKKGNTVTYKTVVESNNDLVKILAVHDGNE